MASAPMIIPLARWTRSAKPDVRASFAGPVTAATADDTHVVTGLADGRVWIYVREGHGDAGTSFDVSSFDLSFKVLCVGHRAAVTALTLVEVETDAPSRTEMVVLSASEDGVLMKWAVADGRCLQCNPRVSNGAPTRLSVFPDYLKLHSSARFVVCSGNSEDITILNASSLEIVRVWSGHWNWVTCSPLSDTGGAQNFLLTSTLSGEVALWSFDESGNHPVKEELLAVEPGMLSECGDVVALHPSPHANGRVAATGRKAIVVFTIFGQKATKSFQIPCPRPYASWQGAFMLAKDRLLAWISNGEIFEYSLPNMDRAPDSLFPVRQLSHSHGGATYSSVVYVISPPAHVSLMSTEWVPPQILLFANTPTGPYLIGWSLPPGVPAPETASAGGPPNLDLVTRLMPIAGQDVMAAWPLQIDEKCGNDITAAILIRDNATALGYESGDIHVTNVMAILKGETEDQSRLILRNHRDAVTVLLAIDPSSISGKNYLLSGGADFAVNIWNLDTGDLLASFKPHMGSIISFVQPPADASQRMKGCVLSIGKDNSVAVVSLMELNCLYTFPGHPVPVTIIQWRPAEDYILFGYDDGAVFVWQMRTAHLERIETGQSAADTIQSSSCSIRVDRLETSRREKLDRNVASMLPIYVGEQDAPHLHVLLVNNKKLVEDTTRRSGQRSGSSMTLNYERTDSEEQIACTPQDQPAAELPADAAGNPSCSGSVAPSANSINVLPPPRAFIVRDGIKTPPPTGSRCNGGSPFNGHESSPGGEGVESGKGASPSKASSATAGPNWSMARTVLSALLSWGLDAPLDACARAMTLKDSDERLTFGLRGANGNLSLLAPRRGSRSKDWTVSHHVTSSRLLALVSLARAFSYAAGYSEKSESLINAYTTGLADHVGAKFAHPSLSYLAKYWLDTSPDTQKACRRILSATLKQLSEDKKKAIVAHWQSYLPAATSQTSMSKSMARSAIVLGIIGAENPTLLPPRACKNVALSLTLLLNENHRTSYQLAAMELCAKGFATWEPHFNAAAVVRTLLTLSSNPAASPVQVKSAQRALVQIGTVNTLLFVTTVTYDLVHSKSASERTAILKVISYFIYKNRTALYPLLPKIVEAVVKALDPNIHQMRQAILKTATATLHDLVKFYAPVAFHGGSQRLAVGTMEGATVLYDLRTATRWHVIEGHAKPVTGVAFSPDGRNVATWSFDEGTLKTWHPTAGLLGMITGSMNSNATSTKPIKTLLVKMDGAPFRPEDFLEQQVRLDWSKEHTVTLRISRHVMNFGV